MQRLYHSSSFSSKHHELYAAPAPGTSAGVGRTGDPAPRVESLVVVRWAPAREAGLESLRSGVERARRPHLSPSA